MAFDPISAAFEIGGKIIDRVWKDPAQQEAAKLELLKLQQSGELAEIAGQMDVDKAEAANPNMFVAGWRPFIGWICGTGLGVQFIVNPLCTWIAALLKHPVQFPSLDLGTLMTLLFGMLGLGYMRTVEKLNGQNPGH